MGSRRSGCENVQQFYCYRLNVSFVILQATLTHILLNSSCVQCCYTKFSMLLLEVESCINVIGYVSIKLFPLFIPRRSFSENL